MYCGHADDKKAVKFKEETGMLIGKRDKVYMCVHFLPLNIKLALETIADDYGVLELRSTYRAFKDLKKAQNIDVIVQAQFDEGRTHAIVIL